jgi:hypothetical protein
MGILDIYLMLLCACQPDYSCGKFGLRMDDDDRREPRQGQTDGRGFGGIFHDDKCERKENLLVESDKSRDFRESRAASNPL